MLDETPKDATVYIINEETGGPYKPDNFRHLFAEIRAKAGIDQIAREHGIEGGLLYMDLRRTAIVHLARAGSSVPEIAAVTGHSITRTAPVTGAAGLCQLPTSGEPPRTTQSAPSRWVGRDRQLRELGPLASESERRSSRARAPHLQGQRRTLVSAGAQTVQTRRAPRRRPALAVCSLPRGRAGAGSRC